MFRQIHHAITPSPSFTRNIYIVQQSTAALLNSFDKWNTTISTIHFHGGTIALFQLDDIKTTFYKMNNLQQKRKLFQLILTYEFIRFKINAKVPTII